jgi:hypothetical protein
VGSYVDSSGNTEGLLLTEAAGTWLAGVEAVLPADAAATHQYASVVDISCPSAGNCGAVGSYVDNSGKAEVLLLTETAGTWSAGQKAVLPANFDPDQQVLNGAFNAPGLSSVSCGSAGNCVAVGSYPAHPDSGFDIQGLLLTETGGIWSAGVEVALPANADTPEQGQDVELDSVSCASAGNCTAVGSYGATSGIEGLLLTETAGNWTPGEAVLPADAVPASPDAYLYSVSCPSAGNCTALGAYHGSSSLSDGLLLSETDGTWSTGVKASLPANANTTGSTGIGGGSVSCASAGNCTAVSTYVDNADHTQGLVLTETAGTWAAGQEAVLPADATASIAGVRLGSVSCASAGNCTAVGSYDVASLAEPLLLTETAGSWTTGARVSLPANAETGKPGSLASSCAPAGGCSAVGHYYDSFGSEGLLTGGNPPLVKLEISQGGRGSGKVSSRPAGIHCGSTCSAAFDSGTSLMLTATPSAGSRFSAWTGGGCPRRVRFCQVDTRISDQKVKATFSLLPKCAVPRVKGKTLKAAKRVIRNRDCRVGKIEYATSLTTRQGHVISQRPKSGRRLKHGAKVNLVVSKGRL